MDEVSECVERTLTAASARMHFRLEFEASEPEPESPPRRRGGLLGPLARAVGPAARRAILAAIRRAASRLRFDGFVEPSRRAYMARMRSSGQVGKEGLRWDGRSGQPLATLEPTRKPPTTFDPWWYLEALRGLTEATPQGSEPVRGTPCRRFAVRVDLERASAAAPFGLHAPSVDRYEELLALPFDVWIDDDHVRRVSFAEGAGISTLELWDFGVSTDGFDWTRIPGGDTAAGTDVARKLFRRARPAGR